MNANATLAAIAVKIVMVNAVVKRGEKVFNAYMISSIRFNWLVVVGSARLFSFCSSVVNRNEWCIAPSRYGCTIGAKKKGVKFFFKVFFRWVWGRGCGRVGVDAWVWALGCGRVGVGARVWALGCGGVGVGAWVGRWGRRDGNGRARDEAGWIGMVAVGWARIASLGLPNPDSDCRLVCDR